MAAPQYPEPVKLFIAVLFAEQAFFKRALDRVSQHWGECDFIGPSHPFVQTNYYESEMGQTLFRALISFKTLFAPELIGEAKITTNEIEQKLANGEHRVVNLDIGYLDHNKFILASVKYGGQKIYIGKGTYIDLQGRYKNGTYQMFEWSFPDFKNGVYASELLKIREIYLSQRKQLKKSIKPQ